MIFSSSVIHTYSDPSPATYLNETGDPKFNFKVYVNNASYDNDDNPYGKIIYHNYINMDNVDDTNKSGEHGYYDNHIPLVSCQDKTDFDWSGKGVKYYCPQFSDNDFFYGNYYSKRFSWTRLAIHFCDNSNEAKLKR